MGNFKELLALQKRLDNFCLRIKPNQSLIKEGTVKIQTLHKGLQPKYIILLSDILITGDLVDNLVRLDHIFDLKEVIVKQQAKSCPDSPNCPVFMVKDSEETSVFEDDNINYLLKTLNGAIEKLKSC